MVASRPNLLLREYLSGMTDNIGIRALFELCSPIIVFAIDNVIISDIATIVNTNKISNRVPIKIQRRFSQDCFDRLRDSYEKRRKGMEVVGSNGNMRRASVIDRNTSKKVLKSQSGVRKRNVTCREANATSFSQVSSKHHLGTFRLIPKLLFATTTTSPVSCSSLFPITHHTRIALFCLRTTRFPQCDKPGLPRMDARAFEAALANSGDNASCRRLFELMAAVATGSYGKGVLGPSVAEAYLHAFTHRALPNRNRRWVGLVLYQLIESSNDVLEHLRSLTKDVRLLSNVILNAPEDLKMVAGIIIRTMILGGMQYADFWSNGAPYSVPFPTDETQVWMQNFQGFMDELHRLKFLEDDGDAGMIYALSISAKDTHDFIQETGAMVLFFDKEYMTAFVLGTAGRIPQCIDLPIAHIIDTDTRMATIRSSDEKTSGIETAQLVISLQPLPWTYLFNAEERDARQITITLENMADAQEAQSIIQEIQRHKAKRKMSTSQVSLDISRSPLQGETSDAEIPAAEKPADERPSINPEAEELSVIPESYPLHAADANVSQEHPPAISGAESSSANQEQENLKDQHNAAESSSGRNVSQGNEGSNPKEPSVTESPRNTPAGTNQGIPEKTVPTAVVKPAEPLVKATKSMTEASVQTGKLKRPALAATEKLAKEKLNEESVFDVPDTPLKAPKLGLRKPITYSHKKPVKEPSKPKASKIPMKSVVPKKKAPPRVPKPKPAPKTTRTQPAKAVNTSKSIAPESSEPSSYKVRAKLSTSKTNDEKAQNPVGGTIQPKFTFIKSKSATISRPRPKDKTVPSDADLSIYDIPPDEPERAGKLKRPVRRSVAKGRNYNEDEEPGYGNEESEYVNQAPTQESTQEGPPNPKKRKLQEPPKTTVSGLGKKRKSNNQAPIPVSGSSKNGVVGRLVGLSQAVTATEPTPVKEKEAVLIAGDNGSQGDTCVDPLGSSPPVLQRSPNQSEVIGHAHGKKRPAEMAPAETPKAKRKKLLESPQHPEVAKVQQSVRSRTHSSQVHVNEAGSPCAADTKMSSGRSMLDVIRKNPTADDFKKTKHSKQRESGSPVGKNDNGLSNPEFIEISDDRSEAAESDYGSSLGAADPIPVQVFSSNSKPVPASPNAASRALSGHAEEEELKTAGARVEMANAASDPFKQRPLDHPIRGNESFIRRLSGRSPDATPVPPSRKKAVTRKPLTERAVGKSLGELAVPQLKNTPEVQIIAQVAKAAQKLQAIVQAPTTPVFVPGTENKVSSYQPLVEPREVPDVQIARVFKIPPKPTIPQLSTPTPLNDLNNDHENEEQDNSSETDPEQTLVEHEGSTSLPTKSRTLIPSSPPAMAQSQSIASIHSLHSSSSFVEMAQQAQAIEEEAEEMEWEAALQPHQRAVSDMLLRLSKRFIHHLVDSESALADIVKEYERDGREVINKFVEGHKGDQNEMMARADAQKKKQVGELKGFAKKLVNARAEFEEC
ncbi:uncharacterized protein BDZ99DRAFT_562502 [Mytilinidion resinicola]|uniref:Uncharacterized protein n=1 Tax=Mytilinidion resinicola TaxID=574789 RepID=A0A6A6YMY6_9PEZI|nr:uncharacterized protein BDZ99DRAFT_562502 [Mytilinidion resinicola]KAF2809908.1 hypothetical protein BDZ99DRAFT_562502 [Mytilinidion resinicola]